MKILFIDNFDSFTYNLVDEFEKRGAEVIVYRNNTPLEKIATLIATQKPGLIVISPGPSSPKEAGICMDVIKKYTGVIPIFGVCLGLQCMVEAYGGVVAGAKEKVHGKASNVTHDGKTIYAGLDNPLLVGRYHSLAGKVIPDCLEVSARSADGEVMGVRHKQYLAEGVQFHPESILTTLGGNMIENMLRLAEAYAKKTDTISGAQQTPVASSTPKESHALVKEMRQLTKGKNLSLKESHHAFRKITRGAVSTAELKLFLTVLAKKGETIDEILGATLAMRAVVAPVKPKTKKVLLDIVGTGGDKKNSVNASTAAAIVASAAGCVVAKHGNRGVSSKSGSADVLEQVGITVTLTPKQNVALIDQAGICFMFAPLHHPAMKYAMPARKELGIKTIFNLIGPLTNPANVKTMVLGVADAALAQKYAKLLAKMHMTHALVVHGEDGFDEISASAKTTVYDVKKSKITKRTVSPEQFGLRKVSEKELAVADAAMSAEKIKAVFLGKDHGAVRTIILLNAGAGIYANNKATTIKEGVALAAKAIDSGAAMKKLEQWKKLSNSYRTN